MSGRTQHVDSGTDRRLPPAQKGTRQGEFVEAIDLRGGMKGQGVGEGGVKVPMAEHEIRKKKNQKNRERVQQTPGYTSAPYVLETKIS